MELEQIEQLLAARRRTGRARQIREAAGYTQADLAVLMGITASAVSRLESGGRQPRADTLLRWDKALRELEQRLHRATKRVA